MRHLLVIGLLGLLALMVAAPTPASAMRAMPDHGLTPAPMDIGCPGAPDCTHPWAVDGCCAGPGCAPLSSLAQPGTARPLPQEGQRQHFARRDDPRRRLASPDPDPKPPKR